VLYLIERSWCPYGVLGATAMNARCGAFDDDLEVGRGWTVNPDGTDTAAAPGRFVRSDPQQTGTRWGVKQNGATPSGTKAFVTGAAAGSSSTANDLDGTTTIRSPAIGLPAASGQKLTFAYVFAHDARSTAADSLRAVVERADGSEVTVWSVAGGPTEANGTWRTAVVPLDAFAGETVRLRFVASDGGPDNLVEVELDDIRVTRPS
jgi:aminopeptidase S